MPQKSNVDTSRLPRFTSEDEVITYFNRFGTTKYFGKGGIPFHDWFGIYVFTRNDGRIYDLSVYEDGRVTVIQRYL